MHVYVGTLLCGLASEKWPPRGAVPAWYFIEWRALGVQVVLPGALRPVSLYGLCFLMLARAAGADLSYAAFGHRPTDPIKRPLAGRVQHTCYDRWAFACTATAPAGQGGGQHWAFDDAQRTHPLRLVHSPAPQSIRLDTSGPKLGLDCSRVPRPTAGRQKSVC